MPENTQDYADLKAVAASKVPKPDPGNKRLFLDIADNALKTKDADGSVSPVSQSGGLSASDNVTVNSVNATKYGVGIASPVWPMTFASATGSKISFYGNFTNVPHYGAGVQGGLLQFYTDGASADIGFGYGYSEAFTERVRIKGSGEVLIGTSVNVASSKLTVVSTTQGAIAAPCMTTAQRNAIGSPAEGLQIYNLTTHALEFWNGTVWKTVSTN